jgi:hypothetical protein
MIVMSMSEAYALLPADAKWSASFGYPGEGGFTEYHRTTLGERWVISNGPWNGPVNWQCAKA